jgi:hypothetical protein
MRRRNSVGKWAVVAVIIAMLGIATLSGCASYYRVKDPATGTSYYTTDIDRNKSGSVTFTDDNTGSKVTLQNSEVTEIKKEDYKANTKKK